MDVSSIVTALGRLAEGLQDARAAAQALQEGDTAAVGDLDAAIDEMSKEIAELKGRTSGGIG